MPKHQIPSSEQKSDLSARLKTGIPAAILVTGLMLYVSPFFLGIIVLFFAIVGIYEFDSLFEKRGIRLNLLALLGSTFFFGGATVFGGQLGLTAAFAATLVGLFFYHLLMLFPETVSELKILGISLFGIVWIPWSLNHLILIKTLPTEGTAFLFLLVLSIWASDTAAYFGGKTFGKMLLAPSISPKKTWEGSACGILGSVGVALIFSCFFIESIGGALVLFIAVGAAAIGQIGDLVESKIKRLCDVKDSGNLFPGHGGVLDRLDGFLTATPLFYYFVYWVST